MRRRATQALRTSLSSMAEPFAGYPFRQGLSLALHLHPYHCYLHHLTLLALPHAHRHHSFTLHFARFSFGLKKPNPSSKTDRNLIFWSWVLMSRLFATCLFPYFSTENYFQSIEQTSYPQAVLEAAPATRLLQRHQRSSAPDSCNPL